MKTDQLAASAPTATIADDRKPEVGTWWWIEGSSDSKDYDRDGKWLGCITEVGSNYVKLAGVSYRLRLAIPDLYEDCTPEPDPSDVINGKIGRHRHAVRELMGEIKRTCARLGVPMHHALAVANVADEASTALATTAGASDALEYKTALVRAKDKTLPELFKKIEHEHEEMARWMKAELIPLEAELDGSRKVTEVIEGKIHTVELYAGLLEQLVCVRDGAAAAPDTRVAIMQRRHYMDEECLARYEAGGMDFKDVEAFDQWLARDGNFERILPHARCIVAFRIRRNAKDYDSSLAAHIRFRFNEANEHTYLYIRNGRQLWRMETDVEFGEQLFPKREDSGLLGDGELWVSAHEHSDDQFLSGRERAARLQEWQEERDWHASEIKQWRKAGKPDGDWTFLQPQDKYDRKAGYPLHRRGEPWGGNSIHRNPVDGYELLTPESIYYDDAIKKIREVALEHNRIAVIVQGLLDRSTCLHPHPPWKIWTPEGFEAGVELVYDVSRAVTPGDPPDWNGYRAQLNKSIQVGCHTIGQQRAWRDAMEDKYGRDWRRSTYVGHGPKHVDMVHAIGKNGACEFQFVRDRRRPKWVPSDRPGYQRLDYPDIPMSWSCPSSELTCIDGYVPGDYRLFYDDARTRAAYATWAPVLLAAEDWHHKRRRAAEAAQVAEGKAARKAAKTAAKTTNANRGGR